MERIKHIPTRRNNSSSSKLVTWGEYKKYRSRFSAPEEYITWYNNRIHGALDLEVGETPQEAFMRKPR